MIPRRRAFTLLEALIVCSLVLICAASAALYQISGQRQSLALEFQAASLQTAQLVLVRLQRDLANMVPGPLATTAAQPTPCPAVTLTRISERSGTFGLPMDDREALLTEPVTWKFDARTHLLSRNGEAMKTCPMEAVEFTFFPCRPGDPAPPYGDTLIVRLVVVPIESLGKTTPQTPRAVFTASFHSSQGTINHLHEDWVGDR